MKIEISRPYGSSTVLQITLGKTMRGIVVLKRLMVEWVVIKGFTEDLLNDDGKIDMWGESRYKVFQKVTENANAAMLHFHSPSFPEIAIKSFFVRLSFLDLIHLILFVHNAKLVCQLISDLVEQLPNIVRRPLSKMFSPSAQPAAADLERFANARSVS